MTTENTGDTYLQIISALANPQRLRIMAALNNRQVYVSELARELQISRPLLYMHLQRLENVGLVIGHHELSDDGKALRFYQAAEFSEQLSLERISEAVKTLTNDGEIEKKERKKDEY